MLAAPELAEAESVEVGDECEVALELQHRVLADRVVRREKAAELDVGGHGCDLREPTRSPADRIRCRLRSVAASRLDVTHTDWTRAASEEVHVEVMVISS